MRPITLRGEPLARGALPAVCIPLVARTADALLAEAAAAAAKRPDLLEWRVDHFEGIADGVAVAGLAVRIKQEAEGLPILFTCRSAREGGAAVPLSDDGIAALHAQVAESGAVDLLDIEMAADPRHVDIVRAAAREHGLALVLSFHDFQRTPPLADLLARFRRAHALGADVGKVAVMPQSPADVLTLLQATWQASEALPIAVAGMAMGPLGAVSRLGGGAFGSALTFAVGQQASAPGQLPIDDLRAALAALQRASLR
ncbi:type I 3-dehydroquinate dehydratase [Ramlibacter sp. MMS24-I3-19]|uniref:type I 3-dehydroquinate dehydratase n=1 Tax=Ramlibacter sp. MMS24-I3-19 TaxID=3416606 RepID=UPI003D086768